MAPELYEGPVYYIVHAPKRYLLPFYGASDKKIIEANRKRITEALKSAAARGIPVIYEAGPEKEYAEEIISGLKKKPRVVWMESGEIETISSLREKMRAEKIVPRKVFSMGMYRNICVIAGAEHFRMAFPAAEIHILEGTNTVFRSGKEHRESYRRRAKTYGISITKKLKPRHFA